MTSVSQGHFVQGNLIFTGSGESYLTGRVHRDAQRASKTRYYVWQPDSHPLWRSVSASSFFDPHWTQEFDCNRDTLYPTEQSLHRWGIAACHPLPNHSWSRTNRDHTVVATQWCLSVPERITGLPRPQHPQTFLASHRTPGSDKAAQTPRPVIGQDDCQTPSAISFDLRSRFHRPCSLRKTTRRRSRLQSHQAWTTFLSSTALLRGTNQRLLAWGAAPWKCSYGQRYPRFAQSLLCQNPFGNQICDHPRRQRILRPQDRRLVGRVQSPLCHRRQTHPTHQTQVGSPEIRLGESRSANSRILLSTYALVSSLPLRSYSKTSIRRVGPTADLVQARELPLSSLGYQSRSEVPQCLALLQWSSGNRTDYPSAQGGLPFGQDPYPSLLCQRRLLSSVALGLQLSELVQAAVFAPGVSDRNARYVAQSYSVNACTTTSDRQSAPTGYARRWPTGKRLETCFAKN